MRNQKSIATKYMGRIHTYEGRIQFTLIILCYLVCPFRQKRLAYLGLNNVKWHWSSFLYLVNWLISSLTVTKLNAGSTAEAAGCGQSEPRWRVDWCSSRTRSGSNGAGYEVTKHWYVWHHCWLLQWQSPRQWSASKGTSFKTCWSAHACILAFEEFHISHPIYMFTNSNSGFVLTKFQLSLVQLLQTSISDASSIIILAEGQVADEVRWYLLEYLHSWSRKQAWDIIFLGLLKQNFCHLQSPYIYVQISYSPGLCHRGPLSRFLWRTILGEVREGHYHITDVQWYFWIHIEA